MSQTDWTWTVQTLTAWDEHIKARAYELGLQPFGVDFRVLDWEQLIDFESYAVPFHYRHWSFGKHYDVTRSAKRYEAHGLPYEMVVNTNPAVAVLLRDNNLVLQILVMAHVYGHADFFASNVWFQKMTRADRVEDTCRAQAREIADFNSDPSISSDRVEELLTAAHALQWHRPRTPDYRRETREQNQARLIERFRDSCEPGEWDHLKPKKERETLTPDFNRVPLEPDEDLLRFLAEYAPLEDWERRVLHIVAAESDRLLPNIVTKIMNEGWATFWHDRIVRSLSGRPPGFEIEYARTMAGVLYPNLYGVNPYWLGLALWQDIWRRYETPDRSDSEEADLPGGQGDEMLFLIRRTHCDASFVSSYLSDRLIAELRLFSWLYEGDHLDQEVYRITDVPDRQGFERIRRKLAATVGLNDRPIIRVLDAHYDGDRTLELGQVHDGRDLRLFKPDVSLRVLKDQENVSFSSIQHMLRHIQRIWRNPVTLFTRYDGANMIATCDRDGTVDIKH